LYVITDTILKDGVDVLCDPRNLIKVFEPESFDIVIASLGSIRNLDNAIHNIKSVCKTGGIVFADFSPGSEWEFEEVNYFNDFYIDCRSGLFIKAIKDLQEVNLAKAKTKTKAKRVKKALKPVAQYIGNVEIYIPQFKKIVNKGDLVPEFPLKEAKARRDFVVINESED